MITAFESPRRRSAGGDAQTPNHAKLAEAVPRRSGQPRLITIDEILLARPQRPIATTRGRGWNGVTVDVHRPYFGCSERYAGLDHHLIGYCPSGSARLVQTRAGVVHSGTVSAGTAYLMPAGCDSVWEGDSGQSVRLRVPPSLVALAGEQLGRQNVPVEIRSIFLVRDPVIERIAQSLVSEIDMKAHPAQALIVDSLSAALAAHLLRSYNAFEPAGLAPDRSLGKLEVARLTEFIEENLDRPICLEDLAALVNVSRFHFSRLFKRTIGITAISYVEQCRILRAKSLILETALPLAEIALMTGFADQSHFTRRFQRQVGCTPAVFAREHGRRRTTPRPVRSNPINRDTAID
jgi:AraC family transcriptional regulator